MSPPTDDDEKRAPSSGTSVPMPQDFPGVAAARPAHEPSPLTEHEDAAIARAAATSAGPHSTDIGGGSGSGGGIPGQKRSSILKKPGAAPSGKRASINLGDLEPRECLAKGGTASPSASPSGMLHPPEGGDSSSSIAASTDSNERKKRSTMDLGFVGGGRSRTDDQIAYLDDSARTAPPPRKRTSGSMGLGFFRSRSQHTSGADWSESETESTPASRKTSGSHAYHHHRTRSATSMASSAASGGSRGSISDGVPTCMCPQIPPAVTDWLNHRLINTMVWNGLIILFTVVLLFGTQVQDLWCHKSSDVAFDVLFTCSFVFLIFDVLLRSVADPNYFGFTVGRRDFRSLDGESAYSRSDAWCGLHTCFQLGSFMFWCDLLSTLSLLWDISYIGRLRTATVVVGIEIDDLGIPVSFVSNKDYSMPWVPQLLCPYKHPPPSCASHYFIPFCIVPQIKGIGTINERSPVQIMDVLVIEIIIAILRTLRVSRFIKTSAVVKTSSKVNWYWLPDRLSPRFWFRKCCGKGSKSAKDGGGILSYLSDSAPLDLNNSLTMTTRSSAMYSKNTRASLSSTGSSMYEEGRGVGFAVNTFIHKFGVQNRRIKEFERQRAATQIQRAWREYCEITGKSSRRSKNVSATVSNKSSKLKLLRSRSSNTCTAPKDAEAMKESQVGSAMRELTGQRVVIGIVVALVLTVLFTYTEINSTSFSTMVLLHEQTQDPAYRNISLDAARKSAVPELFSYEDTNGIITNYALADGTNPADLRPREILNISVTDLENMTTVGLFDVRRTIKDGALVELIDTIFILIIWFFGVTAFAGPVMTLVVTPIERMIRLLSMLVKDPLGYQGTSRYKKFVLEEDSDTKNTRWTKDVLKGMETSFLMSTILRIGSLMKVGFGAAGVEIIRNNLAKGESKDGLVLNTQGTTVQCIFLFCDIRQFTDATESLQEEVFVFTNKIASVIHSICNSYGGSANKNVGDAFLMSWLLSDETSDGGATRRRSSFGARNNRGPNRLTRSQIKADSALLAVIKISIALYNDKFFLEDMTETKRGRLMKKIAKRMGPVVQMGFGLHCGKAVQGAIGTQRKLDATYVSDAVEFAEFLESSTKQFKVNMLMSDAFEGLLSPQVQRRCRKVDQILILEDDMDPDDPDLVEIAEKVDLYTYDMDIDELWRHRARSRVAAMRFGGALDVGTTAHSSPEFPGSSDVSGSIRPGSMNVTSSARSRREIFGGKKGGAAGGGPSDGQATGSAPAPRQRRRTSLLMGRPKQNATPANITGSIRTSGGDSMIMPTDGIEYGLNERGVPINMPDLTLPSGRTRYSLSSWNSEDMRVIRKRYSEGLFFPQFHAALQAYYARDWDRAGETFSIILDRFEDGPARYFLNQIQAHDGVPPRKFIGYNVV